METKEDVVNKLKIQADLGRTPFGRDLGDNMVGLTNSSIAAIESSGETSLANCSNCGFVSLSDNFPSGCPNCGSHDFSINDVGDTENNGGN